jgi:Concanavalin A-like lectin/glucanases superfamily
VSGCSGCGTIGPNGSAAGGGGGVPGSSILAGLPGNVYSNLVGYVDSSDRNSYVGTGTAVTDMIGNATGGTITAPATVTEGAFAFNGASGLVTFTKGAALNDLFAGGGTIVAFVRPASSGEGALGRIADTTGSADAGWFLASVNDLTDRQSFRFQRNFSTSTGGTWTAADVVSPITGTTVRPLELGTWNCIAATYDDGSTANTPTLYANGDLLVTTTTTAPAGVAITDVGNALVLGNNSTDVATFNGQVGIVLLFDRILSLNEIRTIYNDFGRRYGLGQSGWNSTIERGQSVIIRGGDSSQAGLNDANGGNVGVFGGDTNSANSSPDGGDIVIRSGANNGLGSGRPGNLTVLSGAATSTGSGVIPSSAEFGAGAQNNGNAGGLCTIHGGDNTDGGIAGVMIVRAGDSTTTATNNGGVSCGVRGGNARGAATGGDLYLAGGGVFNSTAGTTGSIHIGTDRTAFGPFAATGGTTTRTGDILITTTNPGATAIATGNITVQCGDVLGNSGDDPGDILIQAGAQANTTQANVTAGNVTITAGLNAGGANSVGGGIAMTAGAVTGTGATAATGGDISETAGANAHNSAASRGGNINHTAGAGTGTNTAGGTATRTAGASTGTGVAGSTVDQAGNAAGSGAGGHNDLTPGTSGSGTAGMSRMLGAFAFHAPVDVSPAAGTTNDLSVSQTCNVVRMNPNAAGSTVTGMTGGRANRWVLIWNVSTTGTLILNNADAGSTAANRYLIAGGNLSIPPNGCAMCWYDGTDSRWRVMGQ